LPGTVVFRVDEGSGRCAIGPVSGNLVSLLDMVRSQAVAVS
jgi:hypothetical protein